MARRPRQKIKPAECPNCFGLHMPAPCCPYCGHEITVETITAAEANAWLATLPRLAPVD